MNKIWKKSFKMKNVDTLILCIIISKDREKTKIDEGSQQKKKKKINIGNVFELNMIEV